MGLLIAVLGLVFYAMCASREKAADAAYERSMRQSEARNREWEKKYIDKDLSGRVAKYIDNPDNADKIMEEVDHAFEEIGYRNILLTEKQDNVSTVRANRAVIFDVLLANRGRISRNRSSDGYPAWLKYSDASDDFRRANYNYVKWIADTLQKQGVKINIRYYSNANRWKDVYVIEGAKNDPPFYDNDHNSLWLPLTEDLLELTKHHN